MREACGLEEHEAGALLAGVSPQICEECISAVYKPPSLRAFVLAAPVDEDNALCDTALRLEQGTRGTLPALGCGTNTLVLRTPCLPRPLQTGYTGPRTPPAWALGSAPGFSGLQPCVTRVSC